MSLFKGRLNGKAFAIRWFIILILWWVITKLLENFSIESAIIAVVLVTFYILSIVYTTSLSVRRLHDLGYGGLWTLLLLLPFLNVLFFFYLVLHKGQEGDNKFGLDSVNV